MSVWGSESAIAEIFAAWQLSQCEAEVMLLALAGMSEKETADFLYCEVTTIKTQRRSAYRKAGVTPQPSNTVLLFANRLVAESRKRQTERIAA